MRDNGNANYTCRYTPQTADKHTIMVSYGGVGVPGSPFRVNVNEPVEPRNVRLFRCFCVSLLLAKTTVYAYG